MTTYYQKTLEALAPAIYDVNPAMFHGFASKCGTFPITLPDPWNNDWIHFNGLIKAVKMRVGDSPGWDAVPDSIAEPGMVNGKFFYWNHEISEKTFKSIESNPSGLIAQQVQADLKAQQDYFMANVDLWLAGYLYSTSTDDYNAQWRPMCALSSASTVSNPNDSCASAGTATDFTATKLTGPTATVDAVNTSIGLAKQQFFQQYDSNTHQSMFKPNNTFDLFLHPAVVEKLKRGYLSNTSGEIDYSQSVYEAITKECNVVPSYAFDAAYDGAAATEAQFGLTMNTSENFQIAEAIPYTVEPWQQTESGKYRMRAYWKIFPFVRPYRIGSYWKKAAQIGRITPYATV